MKKIVATLRYGRIWKKGLLLFWGIFAFGLFFLAYSLVFLFGGDKSVSGFISMLFCFILFSGSALYMIIRNAVNIKRCKEWAIDAVELWASARGIKKEYSSIKDSERRKIEVAFIYKQKKYKKTSGTKPDNGFDLVFSKFADRNIKILYSPKYDEVMILDDKT